MLDQLMAAGMRDACTSLGVSFEKLAALTPPPGLWAKARNFGSGQLDAAKALFQNVRGGLGGAANPSVITGAVPPQSAALARGAQRTQAVQNLGTLAPSLGLAGAGYLLHRHNENVDREREQQLQQRPF
jgi:hypothetical protein